MLEPLGRAQEPERGLLLIPPAHRRRREQEFTGRLPGHAPHKARGVTFTTPKSALGGADNLTFDARTCVSEKMHHGNFG